MSLDLLLLFLLVTRGKVDQLRRNLNLVLQIIEWEIVVPAAEPWVRLEMLLSL